MLRRLAWSSVPSPSFSATRLDAIIASSRRYNDDVVGAQIETLRSPPIQGAQMWTQIIYPIMCAATAFTLHMS